MEAVHIPITCLVPNIQPYWGPPIFVISGMVIAGAGLNIPIRDKSTLPEERSGAHARACFPTYEPSLDPSPIKPGAKTNKSALDQWVCTNVHLPGAASAPRRHRHVPGKQLSQLIVGFMVK